VTKDNINAGFQCLLLTAYSDYRLELRLLYVLFLCRRYVIAYVTEELERR